MEKLTQKEIVLYLLCYLIVYVVGLAATMWFSYYSHRHSDLPYTAAVLIQVVYFLPVAILGAVVATFKYNRLSLRTYRKILLVSVLPIIFSWPVLSELPAEVLYSPRFIVIWFLGLVVIRSVLVEWDNR